VSARQLTIVKRRRRAEIDVVAPRDFKLADAGAVDPERLLRDPSLSLYCIDPERDLALFTEADRDVSAHPFVYQGQFREARSLISVPIETLERLAQAGAEPWTGLSFVYHVGRCGSTLLSKMLARVPGVLSLSEPDVFTQLGAMRRSDASGDARIERLARALTPFLVGGLAETKPALVIKTRSMGIEIAEQLHRVFPSANALMVHRQAEPVVASFLRLADGRAGAWVPRSPLVIRLLWPLAPRQAKAAMPAFVPLFERVPVKEWLRLGLPGLLLAHWSSVTHTYERLRSAGLPLAAVTYDDLRERPLEAVKAVLSHLGLDPAHAQAALAALDEDSQKGTGLGRGDDYTPPRLRDVERARIHDFMAGHPELPAIDAPVSGLLDS